MIQVVKLLVLVAALTLLYGCGVKEGADDTAKTTISSATGMEPRPVEVVDVAGIKQLIKKRDGKALFLNLWATWCKPCVEEFPDIVKLSDEMSGNEVEFVAISFDYPDEVESKVQPFLREHKVTFRVLVAESVDPEEIINAIDPEWNGALPTTLVFDASGKRRSFLVGLRSYEQFKKEIARVQVSG